MEHLRGITNIVGTAIVWLLFSLLTVGIGLILAVVWSLLVFLGAEKRHGDALEKLDRTLMPGETLRACAVQLRPFALWSRRKALGITDSRVLVVSRGLLGGFTMRDIQWKDLQDAELNENVLPEICGSSLSFLYNKRDLGSVSRRPQDATAGGGMPTLFVGGVPSEEARIIYSHAQSEEQAWEEKRRIRAIEETRAAAGGVYLNTAPNVESPTAKKDDDSLVGQLTKLKTLLDSGVISDTEFQEMKAKIIARA